MAKLILSPPSATPQVAVRWSVVIPVYNSESTIERLCAELLSKLHAPGELQIVLVDDGSADRSADCLRRLHEAHPDQITSVFLTRNFGEHNAVMAGLRFVTGDYCVVMDDDFQNPIAEVSRMFEKVAGGFDVVYAEYDQKRHSLWRNIGSRIHNAMATHALGKPPALYLSSFKSLSRFLVREIIKYEGPDPYLDAIILRCTRNIGVLPVSHQAREHGASGYTPRKLFGLWGNMIVAFSVYPLRVIGIYGLVTAVVGTLYSSYTVVQWIDPDLADPDRFQRLNASIWFFRGSILLTLSIVGEYVGRIYRTLSGAPQSVVRTSLPARQGAVDSPPRNA